MQNKCLLKYMIKKGNKHDDHAAQYVGFGVDVD